MKNLTFFLLFSFAFLFGCAENQESEQSNLIEQDTSVAGLSGNQQLTMAITSDPRHDKARLHAEVIQTHDIVMPKMSQVNRMVRQIKFTLENDQFNLNESQRNSLDYQLIALEKAEEDMMNWMAEFRDPASSVPHEEAMTYLNQQKAHMLGIDSSIEVSLKTASELLENINKK